ncbi:MAG: tetratricopeptide repeat protein [Sphingobacteriaceae bacterium]|nr:MAG: tetratricopeptide repeat protein [Sphingobacteriaceae bacterium]
MLQLFNVAAQDKAQIASLEEKLAATTNNNEKLRLLGDLCWNYSFISFDKALYFGKQELELAQKIKNDTIVALAYSDIGIVHTRANNLREALANHKKAYELRKKLGLKDKMAGSLTNLAVIYKQLGNYDMAISNMTEALQIYTAAGDEAKQAILLNNIGKFYLDNNKPEDAKTYLLQSIALSKKVGLKAMEANASGNLMGYYIKKEQYAEALKMGDNALKVYSGLNNLNEMATVYNTMGVVYDKMGRYKEALQYNQKSIKIREGLKDKLGIASCHKNIAAIYIKLEQYDEADKYLKLAIAEFTRMQAKVYLQEAYGLQAQLNEKQQSYKTALENVQASQQIKDSLFNRNTADKINELQIKYETARKEERIKLLNKQNIIQKLQITQRNTTIAIIGGLFLILIAFGALFYNRYRLKQEAHLQAEMLRQQNIAAKGIIEAEERERKRIAGDLHDGVGQLFSVVKMNMSGLFERMTFASDQEKDVAEKTLALVDESCTEVRSIAHHMMPNVLLKAGLVNAVKDFVHKIDSRKLRVVLETSGLDERLDNDVEMVLYRVIQECVNNVIKHAGATMLDIQLMRDSEEITITIEDNGQGFDTTNREKFDGIGLKNITQRIEYLKGSADISSSPGRGTLVAIHVPLT